MSDHANEAATLYNKALTVYEDDIMPAATAAHLGALQAALYAAEQTRLNTLAILFTAPGSEYHTDWVRKQLDKGLGL